MNRLHVLSWVGLGLVSVVVLSVGTRPILRAQDREVHEIPTRVTDANIVYVEQPRNVGELKTWMKLQEKISMNFPNDTPLEDVIKYIRQATADPKGGFPKGIPIWVDPDGLKDVEKTLASTVKLELDDIPLETTLRLLLNPLKLTYEIKKDGLLIITSSGCNDGEPISAEEANWRAFQALSEEVRALRTEIRSLRRTEGNERPASIPTPVPAKGAPPANSPAGGTGGGFR